MVLQSVEGASADNNERTRLLSSSSSSLPKTRTKPLFLSRMGSLSFLAYYDDVMKNARQHGIPIDEKEDDDDNPLSDPSLEKTTDYECCCGCITVSIPNDSSTASRRSSTHVTKISCLAYTLFCFILVFLFLLVVSPWVRQRIPVTPTGPYILVEKHLGHKFLDYYTFYDGPDSLGSAGYNIYVSKQAAMKKWNIFRFINQTKETYYSSKIVSNVTNMKEESEQDEIQNFGVNKSDTQYPVSQNKEDTEEEVLIYMSSAARYEDDKGRTNHGSNAHTPLPRASIRLEGRRRFNRGLFILDVQHIPVGCGVWPAFWLTDEANWPNHGEIDIVEGINYQSVVKTALHTRDQCSMYAHVPVHAKTGTWDWAYGIPNTYTGTPDNRTQKEADNCWEFAAHQWYNQGCVAVSSEEGTLGSSFNEKGGGIYVLEWDPENRYIKSWVFLRSDIPQNLLDVIQSHSSSSASRSMPKVNPIPEEWGVLPYAYFAIGQATGCSADHFVNLRIVFNLAFCGNVAGNRYFGDCPNQSKLFRVKNDNPISSCVEWIKSDPEELDEAYWAIRGVYVFERSLQWVSK